VTRGYFSAPLRELACPAYRALESGCPACVPGGAPGTVRGRQLTDGSGPGASRRLASRRCPARTALDSTGAPSSSIVAPEVIPPARIVALREHRPPPRGGVPCPRAGVPSPVAGSVGARSAPKSNRGGSLVAGASSSRTAPACFVHEESDGVSRTRAPPGRRAGRGSPAALPPITISR
jgi:hypothetical protein